MSAVDYHVAVVEAMNDVVSTSQIPRNDIAVRAGVSLERLECLLAGHESWDTVEALDVYQAAGFTHSEFGACIQSSVDRQKALQA